MSEAKQHLHAIVTGRVQGVSFRYYTVQAAREIGVTGWVRNLPDGRQVEVVAEGTRAQLDRLVDFLHDGSPAARVQSVQADWHPATEAYQMFEVTY
jgi:acylphosphatase